MRERERARERDRESARERQRARESERNDVFFCNIVRYIFDGLTQRHINHIFVLD